MRIGINLIQYTDVQGIEVFAKNLLQSLIELNPSDKFIFFVNQNSAKIFNFSQSNINMQVKNFKYLSRWKLILYQQFILPFKLRRNKVDILFCPSLAVPLLYRNKIVTIHDCINWRFPAESGFISSIYLRLSVWSAKYWSKLIVTVSDFSKQEIIKLFKINDKQVSVISEGIPQLASFLKDSEKNYLNRLKISNHNFFLFIGNDRLHKNLYRIIESFSKFRNNNKYYYLVVVGKYSKQYVKSDIFANLIKNVIFIGVVTEEEKSILYHNASALIFTTLYEGFGLPVLEAQSINLPVLTSNLSSLPEIAGQGALFVDPYSVKEIKDGMERIALDEVLRRNLISKGYNNCLRFSWDKAAQKLTNIIN